MLLLLPVRCPICCGPQPAGRRQARRLSARASSSDSPAARRHWQRRRLGARSRQKSVQRLALTPTRESRHKPRAPSLPLPLVAGFSPRVLLFCARRRRAAHSAARALWWPSPRPPSSLRAMDELGGGSGGGGSGTGLRRGFPVLEAPAAPKPEHVQGEGRALSPHRRAAALARARLAPPPPAPRALASRRRRPARKDRAEAATAPPVDVLGAAHGGQEAGALSARGSRRPRHIVGPRPRRRRRSSPRAPFPGPGRELRRADDVAVPL